MKRLITILLVVTILSVNVFAFTSNDAHFSFTTPEGYTELSPENIAKEENEMFLNLLMHSEESFKKYFKDNGIKYFSLKPDNSAQITVRVAETKFTQNLSDMAAIEESEIPKVAAAFLPEGASYAKVQTNGTSYLQTFSTGKDSGGEFSAVTYITIKNGMLYMIVFNYPKAAISQSLLDDSFNNMCNFTITDTSPDFYWGVSEILQMLLMVVGLIAVIIFIVLIVISFVKDIIKKRKEDKSGEFKVKRRKF